MENAQRDLNRAIGVRWIFSFARDGRTIAVVFLRGSYFLFLAKASLSLMDPACECMIKK